MDNVVTFDLRKIGMKLLGNLGHTYVQCFCEGLNGDKK